MKTTTGHLTAVAKDTMTVLVRGYYIGDTDATSVALIGRTPEELDVLTSCLGQLWSLAQQYADQHGLDNSGIAQLVAAQDRTPYAPADYREQIKSAAAAMLDGSVRIDDLLNTVGPAVRVHMIAIYVSTLLLLSTNDTARFLHVLNGLAEQAIINAVHIHEEPATPEKVAGAWRAYDLLDAYGNGHDPRGGAVTTGAPDAELRHTVNGLTEINYHLRQFCQAPGELDKALRTAASLADITPPAIAAKVLALVDESLKRDVEPASVLTDEIPLAVQAHVLVLHTIAYGIAARGPLAFAGWQVSIMEGLDQLLPPRPYRLDA